MTNAVDTTQPLLVLLSQGLVPANADQNGQPILANLANGTTPTTSVDSTLPPDQGTSG